MSVFSIQPSRSVAFSFSERYKVHYVDLDNMDELYDLERDPDEMENVVDSPEYADVVEEMKTELGALLE